MLNVSYNKNFLKLIGKIKSKSDKERVKKQVIKVIENPELGKPMRYVRKGTREVYISPYRLAYSFIPSKNELIFLDLYHKDKQ